MAFRTLLWKRPFLPSALLPSPSSSKCVFTPICLSGSFHESLRFPLDGRARLSMLTTHNRPTFSRLPPPVLQRVPRRSYTRRTNPARGRNRQFKDRLIFLLVACFFSFFFLVEISSSIFHDFWALGKRENYLFESTIN